MDKLGKMQSEGGFSLIEVLVVIAIIVILAAIAIPEIAAHRRRGYDADVKSNLENAAKAEEAYFVNNDTYTSTITPAALPGYHQSSNVTMSGASSATTFIITGAVTTGCSSGGNWSISSATGIIAGTPCD